MAIVSAIKFIPFQSANGRSHLMRIDAGSQVRTTAHQKLLLYLQKIANNEGMHPSKKKCFLKDNDVGWMFDRSPLNDLIIERKILALFFLMARNKELLLDKVQLPADASIHEAWDAHNRESNRIIIIDHEAPEREYDRTLWEALSAQGESSLITSMFLYATGSMNGTVKLEGIRLGDELILSIYALAVKFRAVSESLSMFPEWCWRGLMSFVETADWAAPHEKITPKSQQHHIKNKAESLRLFWKGQLEQIA